MDSYRGSRGRRTSSAAAQRPRSASRQPTTLAHRPSAPSQTLTFKREDVELHTSDEESLSDEEYGGGHSFWSQTSGGGRQLYSEKSPLLDVDFRRADNDDGLGLLQRQRRRNVARRRPLVSFLIASMLLIFFGIELYYARAQFEAMSRNPFFGFSNATLVKVGALSRRLALWPHLQPWRLLTSTFVSAGVIDLFLNLFLLYYFVAVERVVGGAVAAAAFIVGALVSSLSHILFLPSQLTCGASPAFICMISIAFLFDLIFWHDLRRPAASMSAAAVVVVALLVAALLLPILSTFALLSGLLCGISMAFLAAITTKYGRRVMRRRRHVIGVQSSTAVGAVLALLLLLCVAIVCYALFYARVGDFCPHLCPKLDCIQISSKLEWCNR